MNPPRMEEGHMRSHCSSGTRITTRLFYNILDTLKFIFGIENSYYKLQLFGNVVYTQQNLLGFKPIRVNSFTYLIMVHVGPDPTSLLLPIHFCSVSSFSKLLFPSLSIPSPHILTMPSSDFPSSFFQYFLYISSLEVLPPPFVLRVSTNKVLNSPLEAVGFCVVRRPPNPCRDDHILKE